MDSSRIAVIDNGSGVCKAGFSGDHLPRSVFPSIIGRPRMPISVMTSTEGLYIGEEALNKKGILNLKYPIDHGIISNWEDMECIWKHIFAIELRVPSEDSSVLLTEPPLNPKNNKQRMCEIMFESLNVLGVYIGIQAVLSLYSSAMTTGLVLDIGDGVTHAVPTFEGYALSNSIQRLNLAGKDVTNYLNTLLNCQGYKFQTTSELEIVREIKENLCYVALDYSKELLKNDHDASENFTLPDGNVVCLVQSRFQAPEVFFKPDLVGLDIDSVHLAVYSSIRTSDIDVRKELYKNILLSGGSTLFPGFSDRLLSELKTVSNTAAKIQVLAPTERKFSVWIGGSILASLDSFRSLMLTQDEYYESGSSAIHKKCF
jgi:actin, other eukaryote